MPRRGHSDAFTSEFGRRFSCLVREHLCLDFATIAGLIGYANGPTVQKAARGDGCLDIERLALLAKLTDKVGRTVNLHWLITGEGEPMRAAVEWSQASEATQLRQAALKMVSSLDTERLAALVALVGAGHR